jgi:hypothetical protein
MLIRSYVSVLDNASRPGSFGASPELHPVDVGNCKRLSSTLQVAEPDEGCWRSGLEAERKVEADRQRDSDRVVWCVLGQTDPCRYIE